ncbi:MTH538 TIR-like domain [Halorientalis persicus]|uniref:MTH538 TIR-like domain n=1 Tax=Halorientalis persicus TaxID=1367881 RepID=A0A1H8S9U8_9EURY|nr:TIR domain-containing protein [Halorientalis persicus]SEO74943.1 MTH538 TIR-like domain [Halorientalis persicus]
MVRRVFFSFHFDRDHWRANQVRNSWLTQDDRESAGYIDAADWESLKRQGDDAIKRWINDQMKGTSVTAVLIGKETYDRDWVEYEIKKSWRDGNGIVGIRIHNLEDESGYTDSRGKNPLSKIYIEENGQKKFFDDIFSTYRWKRDSGYDNLGDWVEEAAQIAGR